MGLKMGKPRKGSVPHESLIRYTEKSLKRYCPEFNFERVGVGGIMGGGVQPDDLLLLPDGSRIPIQVSFKNQPNYEAEAILKLHEYALLNRTDAMSVAFVLVVATNKRHRDTIERAIKGQNKGEMPAKIALLDFDTAIDAKFDWEEVFNTMMG